MTPDGSQSGAGRPRPSRRTVLRWAAAGAVAAALVGAVVFWVVAGRGRPPPAPPLPTSPPVEDPRVAYAGPFLNVRPEVGYVGDDRCAECHREIAASYHRHPMARSLTPIAPLAPEQFYGTDRHNPFEAAGSRFRVERVGDGVHHRQTRLDESGRPLYENDMEVRYAIGSGVHGYSYLTDWGGRVGGFIFQTPISWFEQKKIWDLSPRFPIQYVTGRPVRPDCLYCHANRTRPVAGGVNHFAEPLFQGYGIGCERCHGPGERHVRDPGKNPTALFDATIVNPARLGPSLRESVCNQCHLEGVARIARRGRDPTDFRPGLPLGEFLAVFVRTTAGGADRRAVNHVEQMEQSGCFRGGPARERIGCISCHDPHVFLAPEERVAHYRQACLNCHEAKHRGCSVPVTTRRRTSPEDSCVQCHMPSYAAADIAHTASTDHRIPRRPTPSGESEPDSPLSLALLHRDGRDEADAEYGRDLGLALVEKVLEKGSSAAAADTAKAVALVDKAAKDFPDDAPTLEAKGRLAILQNRPADALASFEACLARAPEWETALIGAGLTAKALGKPDAGLDYWRRAVEVDPYSALSQGELAGLLATRGRWDEAAGHAEQWVRLDPDNSEARKLSIRCRLKTRDRARAEAELTTLKGLQPGWDADLDHWFDLQQR